VAAGTGAGTDREFGTLLRDSDRVIVLSASHLTPLAEREPGVADRSAVVPPPPIMQMAPEDPSRRDRTRQSVGAGADQCVFVFFGLMYRGKGVETLLRAFREVAVARPQSYLVLVGGVIEARFDAGRPAGPVSYRESLDALVRDLGLGDRVHFTGPYPSGSDQGSAYLRAADICVLPVDGGVYLNNSTLGAAFAHALPIVATRGDVVEPPLSDRRNVLFCERSSPDSMAQAMTRVIDDVALRQTLRDGGAAVAAELYNWERATTRTMAALGF
jgi:glycosyltransferase involved in cell wall biosynthesis